VTKGFISQCSNFEPEAGARAVSLINPDVMPEKDFPLRDDIRLLGRL
jgi:hypothetical protein